MRRAAATAAVAAIVVVGLVSSACTASGTGPTTAPSASWSGRAYPQRLAEPSLRFTATDGTVLNLPDRSRGSAAVLVFAALGDPAAQRFLIGLARAAHSLNPEQQQRLLVVVASTDPDHDALAALATRVTQLGARFIGVRATFPMVESVARGVGLDVERPSAGRYPAIGPQAVGFGVDQVAAVAWRFDADTAGLVHDLQMLTQLRD